MHLNRATNAFQEVPCPQAPPHLKSFSAELSVRIVTNFSFQKGSGKYSVKLNVEIYITTDGTELWDPNQRRQSSEHTIS